MTDLTPRERRQARTRQAILDAARKIIAKEGVNGLSMRTLAKMIDYSPSGIYKYFASKEDIFSDLADEGYEQLAAYMLHTVPADLAGPERLYEAGKAYFAFAAQDPQRYFVMFNQTPETPVTVEEIMDVPIYSVLMQVIEEGIASGEFTLPEGYDPLKMVLHCWVTVHGIVMLRSSLLVGMGPELDAVADQILVSLIDGFTP